jgi:flagellar hook-length control protein FliK
MSNIIHSSSLLNVADGKNEIPVDLSRPKETQQGIDFKDIYSGLANEASRMSPPVDQKPGDGFQKDLATIADARNSDSGELRQQISEVQQPFGKILPTLVAHQRGLSLGKVILTAPVSAVSENSLKQFIMRQSAVDEVIDRGRTTDTEKDESALRGVRSEEMVSALPNKNPRAEIDYGVYSQHIVQKQIVQKQIAPKQTANAQAFAASTVSRAPTSNEMGLNQQQYPSAEMLTARSPSAIGKTESSLGEQIQRPAQAGADLAGVDKDYLGAKQRASTLKAGPVSELSLVLGQTSALDKPLSNAAQTAVLDKPLPNAGQTAVLDKPLPNAAQAAVLDKAPPVLGQTAVLDKPVPVLGQTASWLSQFNTMPREIPSGASMPSAPEGSSVVSRELNSSREEVGLKSEQLLSKDSYSERKANGPQFMASNGESTKPGLISSGAEKPLEEQQMLKSSRLSAEILSSDAREKGFRGKEYSDGVNPKQDMVVEALARNLRMMSPSARQDLNSAGYQGQKPALPGTYGISKRPNGSALEVSDKVNVQNIESRVEFRSVLREMQLQPQLQSTSDKSLQYEGLTQRFGELVANRIIAGVQQDNWNLNIKLRPASLGEIGVTIAYDEGGLEGKIVAAEETTRQLLQDSLPKLRLMLKEMLENDQMVNVNVDSHSDLKQDTKEKPDDENDATVELVMDLLDEATEKVEGRGLGIGNLNIYV